MLSCKKINLHLGLQKPIRVLQLTDVHLSLADDIDGDDLKIHAAERRKTFFNEANCPERDPVGYLEEAMEYSKKFDCTVITGDLIDFMSHANLETAHRILSGKDYLLCAGNHEFCPKVGIPDSFKRKDEKLEKIQSYFRGNLTFESRIVGEVNIITMDNGYYTWTEDQFELLKTEVSRGFPCLVFCHVPFTYPQMDHNPPHKDLRASSEVIDLTRKITKYIIEEPAIKAVFSGHRHNNGTEDLGNKTGYIGGGLFKGIVSEITID